MKGQELSGRGTDEFTPKQELANMIIHLLGIFFGIIAIPFLLALTTKHQDISRIISTCIYALCFLMVFTFSTLYHSIKRNNLKTLFKKLDRISIYFLIAGTYTPIVSYYLYDDTGILLLYILWSLVIAGIFFEIFFPNKFNTFSAVFYLMMGLIFVFVPEQFFASMPPTVVIFILSGVILYCFGVIFYLWRKWHYHHAIWHLFVLVAGICHFIAVLKTVS